MEAALLSSVLSGTLKIVGDKLAPLVMKQYSSRVGVREDLQELHGLVEEIKCWLEIVEDKAVGNAPSLNWLKKLKDVAYDADDLVDEFHLEAEKHDAEGGKHIMSQYLVKKPKSFLFQCKAAHKIKIIRKRFDAIVKQRNDIRAIKNTSTVGRPVLYTNKTIVPLLPNVDEVLVLGRDKEKRKLISKLVETNDQQKIKIISIIGLGGCGKTTLAKLVFNDSKTIEKHFEVTLWVHVSQEFDAEKLIKKLFEALADENPGQHALPYMTKRISDKLSGKRFLLVMDDVWTESWILWDEFMVYLKGGAHGSRILLTTRSGKVAETVGSAYLLDMPLLSADNSWQLFQQSLVTPMRSLESEFEKVGKEIVKKCGGMPLAIKVLAGVLRGKERIEEWQAMENSSLLDVEGEEHTVSVFACLKLSYFHLPSHLKQCFTLCSLFPKGHPFIKKQLIDQWIAHDMISLEDGVQNLDYIGHKCFNSLVQMSFLQDVAGEAGQVMCTMHDLVHDLARSILGDEISIVAPNEARTHTNNYRYFYFTEHTRNLLPKNIFQKARAVRIVVGHHFTFGSALKHANHLRSVAVKPIDGTSVPIAILQTIFQTKKFEVP